MRRVFLALAFLLLPYGSAHACRGPFSFVHNLNIRPYHQVYLGTVVSVQKGQVVDAGTPYERTPEFTTLKIISAWAKNAAATATIVGVRMSVPGDLCVQFVSPKEGEEWLVVAYETLQGTFEADGVMSFKMDGKIDSEALAAVKKRRGAGYSP